jgi:hypothetical protein
MNLFSEKPKHLEDPLTPDFRRKHIRPGKDFNQQLQFVHVHKSAFNRAWFILHQINEAFLNSCAKNYNLFIEIDLRPCCGQSGA